MNDIQETLDLLADLNPEAYLADGLEEALLGVYEGSTAVAVYSKERCVEIMMEEHDWTHEEALEYLEFNTFCAYMGENSPIFITEFNMYVK